MNKKLKPEEIFEIAGHKVEYFHGVISIDKIELDFLDKKEGIINDIIVTLLNIKATNKEQIQKLQELTPRGSEFQTFEECYEYIKNKLSSGFEAKKEVVRLNRKLRVIPNLLKIKDILNDTCQNCKQNLEGCQYTCSILANRINKELGGEK